MGYSRKSSGAERLDSLELLLIATGMHLARIRLTVHELIEDGFFIDKKIEMLMSSDTSVGITKSIGLE